jgi:hypothetical protein
MRVKALIASAAMIAVIAVEDGSARAANEDSVVKLPTYTVTDSRLLPEPEHWRYAAIPSYEILSQLSDAKTQAIARDLEEKDVLLDRVWPGIKSRPRPNIVLILCGTTAEFDAFVPQRVSQAIPLLSIGGLFLHGASENIVVLDVSGVNNGAGYEKDLVHNYILARLGTFYPRLPGWFAEGLGQIVAHSGLEHHKSRTTLTIGKVRNVVTSTLNQGGDTSAPKDETSPNILDFNQYFAGDQHRLPAMKLIFADPPGDLDAVGLNGEQLGAENQLFGPADWVEAATLVTHLCFYGEKQHFKPALLRFLELTSNNPGADPEPLFNQAFHRSYRDMDTILAAYVGSTSYSVAQYPLGEIGIPAAPDLRDATIGEIGQIKGDTLVLAGYLPAARQELVAAYRRERLSGQPFEPRLLAALGVLEAVSPDGNAGNARAFLEKSAADRVPRAEVYSLLAGLRLAAFDSNHPLDRRETSFCLEPLDQAHALCQPDAGIYLEVARIWARSAVVPTRQDLGILNEGIHFFPGDSSLALAAVELNAKFGFDDTAAAIAEFGAGAASDPAARAEFMQWRSRLPVGKQ